MSHTVESCHWYIGECGCALALIIPVVVDVAGCCVVTVEDVVEVSTEHHLLQTEYALAKIECIAGVDVGL